MSEIDDFIDASEDVAVEMYGQNLNRAGELLLEGIRYAEYARKLERLVGEQVPGIYEIDSTECIGDVTWVNATGKTASPFTVFPGAKYKLYKIGD